MRTRRPRFAIWAALLVLPVLLLAHVPLLAALPGAVLTAVSINALESGRADSAEADAALVVDAGDRVEMARIAAAEQVEGTSRRTG